MNQTKTPLPIWMSSSIDPSQVSARVSGAVLAASSLVILLSARVFDVQLTADDVVALATQFGAVAGLVWSLKGTFIWLMAKFGKRTPEVVIPVVAVSPESLKSKN